MTKGNLNVYCRIKPRGCEPEANVIPYEFDNDEGTLVITNPDKDLERDFVNNSADKYKFTFEKVFGEDATQENVYEGVVKDQVDRFLEGYNATVFAYGQTGSGKTFTISGGDGYSDRGIVPRAIKQVFERITSSIEAKTFISISFLEIYNGKGYDLLSQQDSANIQLDDLTKVSYYEDEWKLVRFRNLSSIQVQTEEEALNLFFIGDTNRTITSTPMNLASSRSHGLFILQMEKRPSDSDTIIFSRLNLVDLAGSERAHKSMLNGRLLEEAISINLSLLNLEKCVVSLQRGDSFVPYRESLLTCALKDSLGGNAHTSLITTLSINERYIGESVSSCRFAMRASLVSNIVVINEEVDPRRLVENLRNEIKALKEENQILKDLSLGNSGFGGKVVDDVAAKEKIIAFVENAESTISIDSILSMRRFFDVFRSMYLELAAQTKEISSRRITSDGLESSVRDAVLQESEAGIAEAMDVPLRMPLPVDDSGSSPDDHSREKEEFVVQESVSYLKELLVEMKEKSSLVKKIKHEMTSKKAEIQKIRFRRYLDTTLKANPQEDEEGDGGYEMEEELISEVGEMRVEHQAVIVRIKELKSEIIQVKNNVNRFYKNDLFSEESIEEYQSNEHEKVEEQRYTGFRLGENIEDDEAKARVEAKATEVESESEEQHSYDEVDDVVVMSPRQENSATISGLLTGNDDVDEDILAFYESKRRLTALLGSQ